MTLKDEDRDILINYRCEQAHEAIDERFHFYSRGLYQGQVSS